ncbi:MAG: GHKL domain-containing protein [Candidatus Cloacimonetes bacterium]|nr:GHKL domain-containing protein [Candidatus Cloacimonadota bacterium]
MKDRNDIELEVKETEIPKEKIRLQIKYAHKVRYTDPELSLRIAKDAWQEAKNISEPDLELGAIISICSSCLSDESCEDTETWINLLMERGKELNRNYALGRANLFRYAYSNHYGKRKEAENYLYQALENFDADHNDQGRSTCYISLGNIKFNQGNHDQAYEYYQTALTLVPKENKEILFTLRQNIASVFIRQQEYLKAWDVYHDILDHLPEHDFATRALVLINLGSLCSITGELPEALQYYDEVIKLTKNTPGDNVHVKACCMKAGILLEKGKPEEACKILTQIEDNVKKTQNPYLLEKLFSYFIEYYKAKRDLSGVTKYQAELLKVKDNIIESAGINDHNNEIMQLHWYNASQYEQLLEEENQRFKSELKEISAQKSALAEKLEEANRLITVQNRKAEIGEMVANIAHQWNQPLNIISTMLYNIKDIYAYCELTSELLTEKTEQINDQIKYMSQTMDNFRNFFKEQDVREFPVSKVINNTLDLLDYSFQNEDISIELNIADDFILKGSPIELTQVMLNILNNARDALLQNSRNSRLIRITARKEANNNILSFFNNGQPIPAAIKEHIFEPYITSRGDKGTGLGLSICKTIIEDRFAGSIWCDNAAGGVYFNLDFGE